MWHNLLKLRGIQLLESKVFWSTLDCEKYKGQYAFFHIQIIFPQIFKSLEILIHPECASCAEKLFLKAERPLMSVSHTKINRPFFKQFWKIVFFFKILIHPKCASCEQKPFLTAERLLISATTLQRCAWKIPQKVVFLKHHKKL